MIARVTRGKKGLAKYLKDGKKSNSNLSRDEKDIVVPLYGNLNEFENIENYLNKYKNYKDNYLHITLGFSKSDEEFLENELDENKKDQYLKQMVKDYITHHTSGYDINKEVISYAELHFPKVKYEKDIKTNILKKRYPHIHIAIALLNPLDNTKLQTSFANNSFIDEVLVRRTNLKYNLQQPCILNNTKDSNQPETIISQDRNSWIKTLTNLKDINELQEFLINHLNYKEDVDYRVVNTNKNSYVKLINKSSKKGKTTSINLRGKGFERFQGNESTNKTTHIKDLEDMNIQELDQILNDYYKKRQNLILKRKSKKSLEILNHLKQQEVIQIKKFKLNSKHKETEKLAKLQNTISVDIKINYTIQQKIFYKKYKTNISNSLNDIYIKTIDENTTHFYSYKKDINILDTPLKIKSNSNSTNLKEEVSLMIDISLAKGWKLKTLKATGSKKFKDEFYSQVLKRMKQSESLDLYKPINRPISNIDQMIINTQDKIQTNESKIDIKNIKENLDASLVLNYAKQFYNINIDEYQVLNNKIKKLNSKQKPKSTIDFFTKEIKISFTESLQICNKLLNENITKNEENYEDINTLDDNVDLNKTKNQTFNKTKKYRN